jgi:hypothetical protein
MGDAERHLVKDLAEKVISPTAPEPKQDIGDHPVGASGYSMHGQGVLN